jgi:hypothetical protein
MLPCSLPPTSQARLHVFLSMEPLQSTKRSCVTMHSWHRSAPESSGWHAAPALVSVNGCALEHGEVSLWPPGASVAHTWSGEPVQNPKHFGGCKSSQLHHNLPSFTDGQQQEWMPMAMLQHARSHVSSPISGAMQCGPGGGSSTRLVPSHLARDFCQGKTHSQDSHVGTIRRTGVGARPEEGLAGPEAANPVTSTTGRVLAVSLAQQLLSLAFAEAGPRAPDAMNPMFAVQHQAVPAIAKSAGLDAASQQKSDLRDVEPARHANVAAAACQHACAICMQSGSPVPTFTPVAVYQAAAGREPQLQGVGSKAIDASSTKRKPDMVPRHEAVAVAPTATSVCMATNSAPVGLGTQLPAAPQAAKWAGVGPDVCTRQAEFVAAAFSPQPDLGILNRASLQGQHPQKGVGPAVLKYVGPHPSACCQNSLPPMLKPIDDTLTTSSESGSDWTPSGVAPARKKVQSARACRLVPSCMPNIQYTKAGNVKRNGYIPATCYSQAHSKASPGKPKILHGKISKWK